MLAIFEIVIDIRVVFTVGRKMKYYFCPTITFDFTPLIAKYQLLIQLTSMQKRY